MTTSAAAIDSEKRVNKRIWDEILSLKFRASVAHTFVITGNVRDTVPTPMGGNRLGQLPIQYFIGRKFMSPVNGRQNYDLVVFYDRANGFRFPLPEMKARFAELCGIHAPVAQRGNIFAGGDEIVLPSDPGSAFELIEKVLRSNRKDESDSLPLHTVVILDYAESLFPSGTMASLSAEDRYCIVKLLSWAKDSTIGAANNPIILLCDSAVQLNDSITASASRIEMLEILLPGPEERAEYIRYLDAENKKKGKAGGLELEKGFSVDKFAHQTAGLRRIHLEDIKLTAEQLGQPINSEMVKKRKAEIFAQEYQSVLEIVDPEQGFEVVGGMEHLKEYFRKDVIEPMMSGDVAGCPQGVLFAGASGTGKSIFAEALAYEARMNFVKLDIGKLMGSLVGQSEHNAARAALAITSSNPCVVWIDEVDQAINRGSTGDSGVSNRIFKMLLELMSDSKLRGRVLFVMATNRPDNIDPALKRRGRADKIIPFLPPSVNERKLIFPAVMRRYNYKADGVIDFSALALESDKWVGSDIEAAVVKAYALAKRDKRKAIRQEDIARALKTVIPGTAAVERWTALALLECSDTDLLPPDMRDSFDRRRTEQELKQMRKDSLDFEEPRRARGDII